MLPPFQSFLETNRDDVWRFLVALVGLQEAEDCFQETFLSALRAYPKLRSVRNLKAWILTVAYRKAMDAHRARARRPRPVDQVPDRADAMAADLDPELWSAVRALPQRQQAAVVQRFVNDLPYKDIAKVMSCTEEAARQSVHEGLKKLRGVLGA